MELIYEYVMPPRNGLALEVKDRQHMRLVDLEGKPVVDTAIFNLHNHREKLSTSFRACVSFRRHLGSTGRVIV